MSLQTRNLKLIFLTICLLITNYTVAVNVIRPDCDEYCGNVQIPYPFGTKDGCFLDEPFRITCNEAVTPPRPELGAIEILNISMDGQMRILTYYSSECFSSNGTIESSFYATTTLAHFPFSYTRNKFTAVGCDTIAVIQDNVGKMYQAGCMSLCDSQDSVTDGACSGIGCCQTDIPKGLFDFNVTVDSYYSHESVWGFNPCSFSFLVEQDSYNFSVSDLGNVSFRGGDFVPTMLDWMVVDRTCDEAKKDSVSFACQANSFCSDSDNGVGYRCYCSDGYRGNAYLPNGCLDIDECQDLSNKCVNRSMCINNAGGYNCSCSQGFEGDGRSDGTGCQDIDECSHPDLNDCPKHCINTVGGYTCSQQFLSAKVSACIGTSLVVLFIGASSVYWGLRKRKLIKLKERFFEQNGGSILQHLCQKDSSVKIFSSEALEKATKNYNESTIIGRGGYGTVYRGTLQDGTIVAIKKSKVIDETQIKQFISEVVVLCQINHRNVVRLLGCCLETPAPILVYEFVENGTLFDHLHGREGKSFLPWDARLRIATETAGVLAYLHSQASTPIIHRDVKSANILLDEKLNAKVSDFGASRLVPMDEKEVCTLVQGTLGYMDPEYLHTSQLNEKSDVYSFGVVLVELMTGQKALRFGKGEEERSLVVYFLDFMKMDRLMEVVDECVGREGDLRQIKKVASVAKRCLSVRGEERPYMKEVAMELEGLMRGGGKHQWESRLSSVALNEQIVISVDQGR